MGAAPALAEGTAGVELAGKAERAMAAKPDAFGCPGHKAWLGAKSRRRRERASESLMWSHQRANANAARHRNTIRMRANMNPFGCQEGLCEEMRAHLRCHHENKADAMSTRCHKATLMRVPC